MTAAAGNGTGGPAASTTPEGPPGSGADGHAGGGFTTAVIVVIAVAFALMLIGASTSSNRAAQLLLLASTGIVGLAAIVRFMPQRAADTLFICFLGLLAIPLDKYFGYIDHVGGWPGIRMSVSDVFLLLLVPVGLLGVLLGRVKNRIPYSVLLLGVLIMTQYGFSTAMAPNPRLGLYEMIAALHAFAVAWAAAALVQKRLLYWVVAAVALQVAAHSILAMAQGITGRPIGTTWLGGETGTMMEVLMVGGARLRPAGLFDHPIIYATFTVLTLPVLAAALLSRRPRGLGRLALQLSLALGVSGLILSLSRGAWISAILAIGTLVALALSCHLLPARRIRLHIVMGAFAALSVAVAFGPRIIERILHTDPGNLDVRMDLNAIALRMIAANPLFGHGLNNFTDTMASYDPQDVMEYFPAPVHNLYLLEGAEAGVPALILLVALFGSVIIAGVRNLPRMRDPELQWIVCGLVAGLAGFMLSQVADFSHRLEPLRSFVWCSIGLVFGLITVDRDQRRRRLGTGSLQPGAKPLEGGRPSPT